MFSSFEAVSWPGERLGEALVALARHAGVPAHDVDPPRGANDGNGNGNASVFLASASRYVGVETTRLSLPLAELERFLRAPGPAIVRVAANGYLVVTGRTGTGRGLRVLTEGGEERFVSRARVRAALEKACGAGEESTSEVDALLDELPTSARKRRRLRQRLRIEMLGDVSVEDVWLVGPPPSEKRVGLYAAIFALAYTADHVLFVLSWWLVGRGALGGTIDWGWLAGWALLFATMLPLRMISTWYEGRVAVAAGGLLKRRLLAGAMKLDPDELRTDGAGRHLARVFESEAVESLALSGGLLSAGAVIELTVSLVVLSVGAGGTFHALLLVGLLAACGFVGFRGFRARRAWTDQRLKMSHDVVERMVGHRTRRAQQAPSLWHTGEDAALATYQSLSRRADRRFVTLAILPRAWLPIGVLGLAGPFILGEASVGGLAAGIGGTLLAFRALKKLAGGFADLIDAGVAWRRVSSLFHAARREPAPGEPAIAAMSARALEEGGTDNGHPLLEARDVAFQYPRRSTRVLDHIRFSMKRGEQVLLTSRSGGGKTTLVSLVNGLRAPRSGLLLLDGVDRGSLGAEVWTRRVATAPQFHENYVFTESFAFNLLMGRRWPPTLEDWQAGESLCRELGLGELLEKMPGGMNQLVGDTGWQLSHGERSRLFLARALLQDADLVILDESFAALDPDNLRQALACARRRAESLLVVAHP